MDQAERAQTIDTLVQAALNLFGDDRDINHPFARGLQFGLVGLWEPSITYANAAAAASLLGAAAYRRGLQSLSDADLLRELRGAAGSQNRGLVPWRKGVRRSKKPRRQRQPQRASRRCVIVCANWVKREERSESTR
jgi:hypothetical protein